MGSAVPTGAEHVCGVVGVMQVAAPPSELPVTLLPLPLPVVAPVLAPDFDAPDDVPVAAPEGAPLLVPADAPDAPPEDAPVAPPEEPPLVDPVEPLVGLFVSPEGMDAPGFWEQAATNDAAAIKPHDSQVLIGLISKLSQASLRDRARASLLAQARPRIR
jgi:hypothetical protein